MRICKILYAICALLAGFVILAGRGLNFGSPEGRFVGFSAFILGGFALVFLYLDWKKSKKPKEI